jgi:hypothetical protein
MIHVARCKREHDDGKVCRDFRGSPLIVPRNGKPEEAVAYRRASSFGDCLDDKSNLGPWGQANAVRGGLRRPELVMRFASEDDGWVSADSKRAVRKTLEEMTTAGGGDAKSIVGTSLHTFTERQDRGEKIDLIPEQYRADLAAYEYATRDFTHLLIERFMVLDQYRIAGTPDRVSFVPYPDPDGNVRNRIVDLKTGSIDYPSKMAIQLGVYAHSETYDPETYERGTIGEVDKGWAVIIHLPAGTGQASLVWLDIRTGYEAVSLADRVKTWRSVKNLTVPISV